MEEISEGHVYGILYYSIDLGEIFIPLTQLTTNDMNVSGEKNKTSNLNTKITSQINQITNANIKFKKKKTRSKKDT